MRRVLLLGSAFLLAIAGVMLVGTVRGDALPVASSPTEDLTPLSIVGDPARIGTTAVVRKVAPVATMHPALTNTESMTYYVHLPLVVSPLKDHSITDIVFAPPSPAVLSFLEPVTATFSYSTTYTGPFYMWTIGYADGVSQAYRCSPTYYGPASGTAASAFTVFGSTGSVTVDTVRFLMKSTDRLEVLVDFTVPVQYTFTP